MLSKTRLPRLLDGLTEDRQQYCRGAGLWNNQDFS